MNVTLRQLRVFEAVARHLSYTRAAEELHLSQPAVSIQVKQLEESVGLPMFEHLGKKNYLTTAGKEMYYYCKSVLELLDEAEEVIQDMRGLQKGTLEIGVATTANDFATRLLAAFAHQYENLKYRLDVTNRETLLSELDNNEIDLVIMGRPPEGLDLVYESFMDNPLVIIAAPDHPLVGEKNIPAERIIRETFVVREKVSGTRIASERYFASHGVRMTTSLEMTSNEAIKQAVQAGLGLGIVSVHTAQLELETGRLKVLDVEDFPIVRHWYLVHRKGKRFSAVAQAFHDFVLEHANEFASHSRFIPSA